MPSTPVTMISGFLGAGKTTILRELLSQGKYKIGCVVNDVAAINIDAKLVRNQTIKTTDADAPTSTSDLAPTIELQNGCACCSVQDELFMSFEQILAVGARNKVTYDRIVLENSGVAEPQNIRDAFAEAREMGHPVIDKIHLSTLLRKIQITVVDSHTFINEYACRNPVATRPDLGGDQSMFRPVVDLLVEQIEVADYVILNKVDLLGEEHVPELTEIIRTINPLCVVLSCSQGKVDLDQLFGPDAKALLAALNTEGQHRGYVASSKAAKAAKLEKAQDAPSQSGHGHDHGHDHSHDHKHDTGEDHSHDHKHEHAHDHGHEHGHDHHKHDHGHKHDHVHKHEHGHDHKHDHDHDHSHDHGHKHSHDEHHRHHDDPHHGHNHAPGEECGHDHGEPKKTTAETRFGIATFVYSRRRPFHPQRLRETVLKWMPVSHNAEVEPGDKADNESPIKTVMRSKGFAWLAHGHASAYYWSHAGQHFEMRDEGDWWAAVEDEEWPGDQKQRAAILADFEVKYGDRRQEIVFIGIGMDQPAIEAALDVCLLTDKELQAYDANWAKLPDPAHPGAPAAASADAAAAT